MHLMNIVPQLKSEAECQIWWGGESTQLGIVLFCMDIETPNINILLRK